MGWSRSGQNICGSVSQAENVKFMTLGQSDTIALIKSTIMRASRQESGYPLVDTTQFFMKDMHARQRHGQLSSLVEVAWNQLDSCQCGSSSTSEDRVTHLKLDGKALMNRWQRSWGFASMAGVLLLILAEALTSFQAKENKSTLHFHVGPSFGIIRVHPVPHEILLLLSLAVWPQHSPGPPCLQPSASGCFASFDCSLQRADAVPAQEFPRSLSIQWHPWHDKLVQGRYRSSGSREIVCLWLLFAQDVQRGWRSILPAPWVTVRESGQGVLHESMENPEVIPKCFSDTSCWPFWLRTERASLLNFLDSASQAERDEVLENCVQDQRSSSPRRRFSPDSRPVGSPRKGKGIPSAQNCGNPKWQMEWNQKQLLKTGQNQNSALLWLSNLKHISKDLGSWGEASWTSTASSIQTSFTSTFPRVWGSASVRGGRIEKPFVGVWQEYGIEFMSISFCTFLGTKL